MRGPMIKIIKWMIIVIVVIGLALTGTVYGVLSLSLPSLSGTSETSSVSANTSLERDKLGQAVISAENRFDVAYALGYAHSQDRFFQMDLLRRNAAGELSELFGKAALNLDKEMRFHQFRKKSELIYQQLPFGHKAILERYTEGVNDAQAHLKYANFEYLLTGADRKKWRPEDSLLTIFSMYLDLQTKTFERDLALEIVNDKFGENMVNFLTQPSAHQAALDGSEFALKPPKIPHLNQYQALNYSFSDIEEPLDIGSNNWAVTGALTSSGHAMLADDMHLSLSVPIIWYRAQLNYIVDDEKVQVTGVSLPGAPAIVVGTNNRVAWGFTNAYIDTVDWVKLDDDHSTQSQQEIIKTPDGNEQYNLELSRFGPVKTIAGNKYALKWVAHQGYAVDMELLNLEKVKTVEEALVVAKTIGIPVQNMLAVDNAGNAAWQATGAIPGRQIPSQTAISEEQFDVNWEQDAADVPFLIDPEKNRLWTGNSRVVSVSQSQRFGNGGYALGARAEQIKMRLFEKDLFDEQEFYQIQLDNEAIFLKPWQELLLKVLSQSDEFSKDIAYVENWQACACAESVGYTLVRSYRSALISRIFSPIEHSLNSEGVSLKPIKNDLEPAAWQLINSFPDTWLSDNTASWPALMLTTYQDMRRSLLIKHTGNEKGALSALTWGEVNALEIKHPFSAQMPLLSKLLDMPKAAGFGDSFMPAVQRTSFGASQRFFVQPGLEQQAILTLPGGQSGHPLSPYYRAGFDEYVKQKNTPLLPGAIVHRINFVKK